MGKPVSRPGQGWVAIAVVVFLVLATLADISGSVDLWNKMIAWGNARLGLESESLFIRYHGAFFVLFVLAVTALLLQVQRWAGRSGAEDGGRQGERALRWEKKARDEYVEWLSQEVKQRIKGSIHHARELDLGLDESPSAVEPWHYVAPDPDGGSRVFVTFKEAFEHFQGRVLLLGAPGSGKSTTLLFAARYLLAGARDDLEAPIPVLLNLSSFRDAGEINRRRLFRRATGDPREDLAFDRWLIEQLARLSVPGREIATRWVEEGRIALLLDGLDEVHEDAQSRLLKALDQSYLKRFFFVPVIVCSRLLEYQRLADRQAHRLGLKGAVTLQPLDRNQIRAYLEAAAAGDLAEALVGDEQFYELATTPLTLSMMTLAYPRLPPTEIPAGLPLTERRGQLFDAYVDRMMQRVAHRRTGKPFDPNPALDEPTGYSRGQVDRILGWFAVRLSERALTSFSLERLVHLLKPPPTKSWKAAERGPFLTDFLLANLIVTALVSAAVAALVGYCSMRLGWTKPLLLPLSLAALVGPLLHLWESGAERSQGDLGCWLSVSLWLGWYLFSYATLVSAIAWLLPWKLPGPAVGAVLLALFVVFGSQRYLWFRIGPGLLAGGLSGALAGLVAAAMGRLDLVAWSLPAILAIGVLACFQKDSDLAREHAPWYWSLGLAFAAGLLGIGQIGIWLCGVPGPVRTVAFGAGLLSLVFPGRGFGERGLLTLCARAVLVARGSLPVRTRRFLGYAVEAMLLKRVGHEYEFVHRLLRDHFAIRELRPLLKDERGRIRLQVLEHLSYQGNASFDALAELARHRDRAVRVAAVEGLGRLPTPEVGPLLGNLLQTESDAGVRRQAVESLGALSWKESGAALWAARWDPDPAVRLAVVRVAARISEPNEPRLLWSALWDEDGSVAQAAADALGDVPLAMAKLEVSSLADERRLVERLPTLLADESDRVRGTAARLLGFFGSEKDIELLCNACWDPSKRVRQVASCALGEIRTRWRKGDSVSPVDWPSVERGLIHVLKDRSSALRESAASDLRHFAGAASLDALLGALADPEERVRDAAARSLRERKGELVPQRLLGLLTGRRLGGVLSAVQVLEVLPADGLRAEFLAWLEQGSRRQKRGAALALGALRVPEAAPGLHRLAASRKERMRRQIAEWLRLETVDLGTVAAAALLGVEWTRAVEPQASRIDRLLRSLRRLMAKVHGRRSHDAIGKLKKRDLIPRPPSDQRLLSSYRRRLLEEPRPGEPPAFWLTRKSVPR